jgi:phosphinothricin acetyltransferase
VLPADAGGVAAIYNHYVEHTIVTFEESVVPDAEMARRVAAVVDVGLPWIVAEEGGRVVGYAYAGPWKGRSGYRHTVETSVYLAPDAVGRGLGTALCLDVLARVRDRGTHAVIAGIALPNPASVRLHENLGMRRVATFPEVGLKFGRWIDVAYWQRLLEPDPNVRKPKNWV